MEEEALAALERRVDSYYIHTFIPCYFLATLIYCIVCAVHITAP